MPNRRVSTDTSTVNFSAISSSSASRLLRQHVQPQSSETHSSELVPRSYFTSGIDVASPISSDVQTAYLSDNHFSEVLVPTPVHPTVRLPEYFTTDNSRPPTPNFAEYPLLVDGIPIYEPRFDPRFTLLAERFIHNNDTLSDKRKELELKRLQKPNLELKFEVKFRFQGLNPHPVFQVAKLEYKNHTYSFYCHIHRFQQRPYSSRLKVWQNHVLQPILRPQIHYILLIYLNSHLLYKY